MPLRSSANVHSITDFVFLQSQKQIVGRLDFFAIDGGDDIAQTHPAGIVAPCRLNACLRRGAAARDIDDQHAGHAQALGDLFVGYLHAETGANDFAETNQFGDDAIDRIDGNRETDSRRYARRTVDRRVDADQTAGAVEQAGRRNFLD